MSYQPSLLEQIQLDMFGRIQACADLAGVPAFVLRPRSAGSATMIQDSIDKALAGVGVAAGSGGNLGAAILVNLPEGEVPSEATPGPFMRLIYSARVFENPLINMGATGTQISAEEIVLRLLNLLHLWFAGPFSGTMMADKRPFTPVKEFLTKNVVSYDVFFALQIGLRGRAKTQAPVITGDAATGVTITGPAGAAIWYTLDGTYPWSGNPTAVLDAGVIAVTPGQTVSAVSYINNQTASDLAALHVS